MTKLETDKGFIYLFMLLKTHNSLGFYLSQQRLLESIAQTTGGMYAMVHNMDGLSTFFRRQVLLSRFIAKFAHGESDHTRRCYNQHKLGYLSLKYQNSKFRHVLMLSFQPLKTIILSALPLHTVFLQAPFLPSIKAIRGEWEKGNLANGSQLLNVCDYGRLSCSSVTLTRKTTSSYSSRKSIAHHQVNYHFPKWFVDIRLYVRLLGRKRHP